MNGAPAENYAATTRTIEEDILYYREPQFRFPTHETLERMKYNNSSEDFCPEFNSNSKGFNYCVINPSILPTRPKKRYLFWYHLIDTVPPVVLFCGILYGCASKRCQLRCRKRIGFTHADRLLLFSLLHKWYKTGVRVVQGIFDTKIGSGAGGGRYPYEG